MNNNIKRIAVRVFGKVQGVFFRKFILDEAVKLGPTGFVRNEKEGSVYFEAQGDDTQLMKLVELCREGSKYAKVDSLQVDFIDVQDGESNFKIR